MPNYDYKCSQCKYTQEIFQKITEEALKLCPQCGHETFRRGPGGGSGIVFSKGFYNTGYVTPPSVESDTSKNTGCCPCGKSQASCGE